MLHDELKNYLTMSGIDFCDKSTYVIDKGSLVLKTHIVVDHIDNATKKYLNKKGYLVNITNYGLVISSKK